MIAYGPSKTSVRTDRGLAVDLRVVPPDCWGAALQYFTGAKAHNIRTREPAVHQGLKLSEYGLFDAESGERAVPETEEEVYARLGLPWIPPPLREDRDEIFAACARTGTALEINSHPDRLDLRDEDILRARRHGVKFAVDSDAHAVLHLANTRYGVGTAQRGWLTRDGVINTWPETRLRRFLRKGRRFGARNAS